MQKNGGETKCVAILMISTSMLTLTRVKTMPMSTSMTQSTSTDTSAAINFGINSRICHFQKRKPGNDSELLLQNHCPGHPLMAK